MAPAGPHGSWEILRRNGLKNKGNMLKKRVKFDDGKIGKEVNLMPGFDRSGPMGTGPMTGGRRGFCNPRTREYPERFTGAPGFGRGMGLGRGFRAGFGPGMGRSFGRRGRYEPSYYPAFPQSPEEELNMLKAEASAVKNDLDRIKRRIAELEQSSE